MEEIWDLGERGGESGNNMKKVNKIIKGNFKAIIILL